MKLICLSLLMGLFALHPVDGHAADLPRVVQRKSHTMHRPSAAGNLNSISWQKITLSDDGIQLAAVGTQRDTELGLLKSNLHNNGSVIAVWTLKTGKSLRADRSDHVLDGIAFSPDGRSLVSWGSRYEFVPSNLAKTFSPIAYWDFSKPKSQTLHADLGKPENVLAGGYSGAGKSMSLILVTPLVTKSLTYKFEPPKLFPKPKVETTLLETSAKQLPRATMGVWAEPIVMSRDGTTLAVNTNRNVQVIDVAQGTVASTSESRLGNTEMRLPLAISNDGSRIAFAIQPAADNEPSAIVVADGKSGRTIATCRGHLTALRQLVMTPDGTRMASTGVDKTVRVWEATTGRELVTITSLSEGVAALAITADGQQVITALGGGDVEIWNVGEAASKDKKNPAGPVDVAGLKAPVAPPLNIPRQDFKPTALTKPQESLYLTFTARRLMDRAATFADFPADSAEVRALMSECLTKRDHARALGVEAVTVSAFENIPKLWQTLAEEATKRNQVLRENVKLMRELAAAEKANEDSMQFGLFVGLMTMVVGELPMYSSQYDPISRSTLTVESGTLSPAISEFGMNTAMNSLLGGFKLKQQLAEANSMGNEVLRRVTSNSLQRHADAISAARQPLDAAMAQQLGGTPLIELPNDDSQKQRRPAKEFEAVLMATTDRADQLKKSLNRIEPFSAADVIAVKSLVSIPTNKRADEWYTLALEMMALTYHVPAGAVYDTDRAALLGMAADLGSRALALERGTKSWEKFENGKAMMVLADVENALQFDPEDRTGILREQKAWALCEFGRLRDGYLLAQEIKPIRGHSSRFRLQLARAAHCVGRSEESLDELGIAIERLGLSDLKAVRSGPDLPKTDPRFKELTTIQLEAVSEAALRGGKARVVNRSGFPLTNARFEMTFPTGRGSATSKQFVAYLAPGDEFRIAFNDNFVPKSGGTSKVPPNNGTVRLLSSDQGTATTSVK